MKQKLKTKQKKKSELSSVQKVAIKTVQKQLQILNLKEVLLLVGFTLGAALLRIPMQAVPSAEPLTFFAVLSGWLFGRYKGFMVGASSLFLSNFFMFGGQGPWTPFQLIGFGLAGFLGGLLRKKATIFETVIIMASGTLLFEIIMNSLTPFYTGVNIFIAFALALPFTLMHFGSNILFALGLPSAKKFIEKTGGFNERSICVNLLNKYNIRHKFRRFSKIR